MQFLRPFAAIAIAGIASFAIPAGAQDTTGGVDQTFVTQFVHANDHEIEQAQAELTTATDPGVILFANTMIKDHTAANAQVASTARALGLTYPQSHIRTGSTQGATSPGRAASPMAPHAYMELQVQEHQNVIGLLQGEADNGSSAQLKTIAAQTLPVAKAHLAMAQQFLTSGTVSPEVLPTPGS
jgi:putative membrane protein